MRDTVQLDVDDGVATITIDRPEHRNGMNSEMVVEMYDIVHALARRTDVRIVVLTGAGDRFFCPGADLDASRRDLDEPAPPMPDLRYMEAAVVLHEMPAVTIAAINGSCAGAGLGWAAGCDLRVASSTANFATAFLDVGVAGDMGLPWSLSRIVGGAKARELFFLRGKFSATDALEVGLVSAVFEPAEFRAGIGAIVTRLRNASPEALRSMKANFVAAERMSFGDFVALESERHVALVTGPSFQAGVARFLAHRES
jgi:2-(1,2-epoxy-1,2-dihydrophenyl)acetyl-CoA isomerase